ncbi:hypothetical protein SANTM175S_08541 [Streptomyces antimycoticus]
MRPRIDPQDADDFAVTPAGQVYLQEVSQSLNGILADRPPPNVHRTIANHPTLLPAMQPLMSHVAGDILPPRERELVILRTAWRSQASYVWAHHHAAGLFVGLTETEIARAASEDATGWTPFEAALLTAVDELHTKSAISDGTWKQLAERYSEEQILELLALAGTYKTLSFRCQTPAWSSSSWRPSAPCGPNRSVTGVTCTSWRASARSARRSGAEKWTPMAFIWLVRSVSSSTRESSTLGGATEPHHQFPRAREVHARPHEPGLGRLPLESGLGHLPHGGARPRSPSPG